MAKKKAGSIEQGTISIHTENIFPIIKKWLYSDKEIFLRELVANGVDAIRKLQHVNLVEGLQLAEEYAVEVTLDAQAGTLTVRDNGIGMDADEVQRYINQIAFSSAEEFLQKYQDLNGQERQDGERTLLINTANPVVRNLLALHQQGRAVETEQLVAQVYDLAMLSCQAFDRERMERFLERSHQLLARIEPGSKGG